MKKVFVLFMFVSFILVLTSCSRGMTPGEAASGRQKCGRGHIR